MAYKVNATRNEDGSYTLSYGKGSKKLTGLLSQQGSGWSLAYGNGAFDQKKTKREAVAAWEAWAASVYGGTSGSDSSHEGDGQTATTQHDAPPAPHVSGPPPYKPAKSVPAERPAETKVVVGLDGIERRIVYSDGGSVISRQETNVRPHQADRAEGSDGDHARSDRAALPGPPRYQPPHAAAASRPPGGEAGVGEGVQVQTPGAAGHRAPGDAAEVPLPPRHVPRHAAQAVEASVEVGAGQHGADAAGA